MSQRPSSGPRRDDARGRSGPPRRPPTSKPPAVDGARQAALELLTAVRSRDAYANLTLPAILRERGLTGRDAALATELAYGSCRALGQLDAVIAACGDRPLAELDGVVLDALRLGSYQLLRTRIPSHAAVSATVDLVRAGERPGAAGYVNAVLRRVADADLDTWISRLAPAADADPLGHLGMATAHPRWIVSALADALAVGPATAVRPADAVGEPVAPEAVRGPTGGQGPTGQVSAAEEMPSAGQVPSAEGAPSAGSDAVAELAELAVALRADDVAPLVHLVARPGRIGRDELVTQSGGRPARFSPFGVYLDEGNPGRIRAVADGRAAVQDEGSQLVALALARAPVDGTDARWLDLAAGPGGKAALLGALAAQRGAALDAIEPAPHRADLVRAATAGLPVTVHTADGRDPDLPAASFDRVLLDAPCTGLGALRRRPESRWRRTPADVALLVRLQRELLESAARLVRPGGLVAYATCSPHLSETAGVIARRPDGLDLIDARPYFPGLPDLGDGPTVQLWPHRHGTDGMFLALLRGR